MFARDVERLHAVLGLKNGIAVGVKQIVEELHVQLIVLHDQNRFCFGIHDLTLHRARVPNRDRRGPEAARAAFTSIRSDVLTLP